MVAKLSEKQPLTFEWLNSLVDAINKADSRASNAIGKASAAQGSIDAVRKIIFSGDAINSAGTIRVIADQHQIAAAGKSAGKNSVVATVAFPSKFKDNSVVVVATADFLTKNDIPYRASVSVGAVTANGFKCRVTIVDDSEDFDKKSQAIVINYIAVGDA
jgi:hypothetical protein